MALKAINRLVLTWFNKILLLAVLGSFSVQSNATTDIELDWLSPFFEDHQQLELLLLEALSDQVKNDNKTFAAVLETLDSSQQNYIDSMVKTLVDNEDLTLVVQDLSKIRSIVYL